MSDAARHPIFARLYAASSPGVERKGGAVGVLFAPPRLTRRATAIAAVIAALLALVAVSAALGPVAFAQAETDAPAGTVTGAVLGACASCLVLAGALVAGATRWAARTG